MLDAYYTINGVTSDKFEPKNSNDIEVLATFDRNSIQPNITIQEIEFVQEAAEYINNYIDNGISGGYGIFEMLPFKIELKQYDDEYNAFEGLIDLSDGLYREDQYVKVKIRDKFGLNNLEDRARAVSWAYLKEKGYITESDYTKTAYVINDIPDGVKLAMLALTAYLMSKEIIEAIKQTSTGIKDATQETAGGVTGAIGAAIGIALEVILVLAYMVAMLIYIYKLMEEIIAQIYSDVRYYRGLKVLKMMQSFCSFYGLSFKSSILEGIYSNLVFLPQKKYEGNRRIDTHEKDPNGFPEYGYGYSCFDIFQLLMDMFNAKYVIKDNTLYLESLNNTAFWELSGTYIMPNIEVLNNGYNTDELNANYLLSFTTDDIDMNTLNNFKGTNYQVITESIASPNRQQTSIKGLKEINLSVARATRKTELTLVENALKSLMSVVDGLISVFGGSKSFSGEIKNRIGMMNLTSDAMSVPKLLISDGEKIAINNNILISASYIYAGYHSQLSFVSGNNQYKLYKGVTIPFGFSDFLKCIDNAWFVTESGEKGKFEMIHYNFNNDYAVVDYRIKQKYTTNLREFFIEPE